MLYHSLSTLASTILILFASLYFPPGVVAQEGVRHVNCDGDLGCSAFKLYDDRSSQNQSILEGLIYELRFHVGGFGLHLVFMEDLPIACVDGYISDNTTSLSLCATVRRTYDQVDFTAQQVLYFATEMLKSGPCGVCGNVYATVFPSPAHIHGRLEFNLVERNRDTDLYCLYSDNHCYYYGLNGPPKTISN